MVHRDRVVVVAERYGKVAICKNILALCIVPVAELVALQTVAVVFIKEGWVPLVEHEIIELTPSVL